MAYTPSQQTRDIIEDIVGMNGLFKKIFGDELDLIIYDRAVDSDIEILEKIYGFNVGKAFERQINRKFFMRLTKVVFKFFDESKQGMFSKMKND